MRFCFMSFIQQELDDLKNMWNTHYTRDVRNSECPPGRPNVIYFLPEQFEARNCCFPINVGDIEVCKSVCEAPSITGCSDECLELARIIMQEKGLDFPLNINDALNLFIALIQDIEMYI